MPQLSEVVHESDSGTFVYVHRGELDIHPSQNRSREIEERDTSREGLLPNYTGQLLWIGLPQLVSDLLAATASYLMVFSVVIWFGRPINHFPSFLAVSLIALTICLWVAGCYPGVGLAPAKELRRTVRSCVATSVALLIGLLAINNAITPYLQMVVLSVPLLVVFVPLSRCFTKDWMRTNNIGVPFYFVGNRQDVKQVYQDMNRFSWTMLKPSGRFSPTDRSTETNRSSGSEWDFKLEDDVPYLGTIADALKAPKKAQVNWLFFVADTADPASSGVAERLEQVYPQFVWVSPQTALGTSATSVLNCGLAVGLRSEKSLLLRGPRAQKRVLDLVISSALLVALSPLFLLIAMLVRLTSRGPVLLRNPRIGQDGEIFHAWKFRSMVANADDVLEKHLQDNPSLRDEWNAAHKLKDDPRVTTVGRFLRKTSLDEIPQLWNVLMGQMSLVGPRPILAEEVVKYGDTYQDYLKVRPGITGLWQVSGRNNTAYSERLVMVRYYVQNWSPWLDLYILLRTIRTVVMCEGSY